MANAPLAYHHDGLLMDAAVGPISYLGSEETDVTRWQSALFFTINDHDCLCHHESLS